MSATDRPIQLNDLLVVSVESLREMVQAKDADLTAARAEIERLTAVRDMVAATVIGWRRTKCDDPAREAALRECADEMERNVTHVLERQSQAAARQEG